MAQTLLLALRPALGGSNVSVRLRSLRNNGLPQERTNPHDLNGTTSPLRSSQIKCHTMPSLFRPNWLKTKKSSPHEVSHFFEARLGSPIPRLATPASAVSRTLPETFAFSTLAPYNGTSFAPVMSPNLTQTSRGLYRFAVATSCCTILLLMAGALVTSNNAAESVPDWPLAYGRLIPPLIGGIKFEYTHRVIAGVVSILTLILAVWLAAAERRPLAKRLGWTALGLVVGAGGSGRLPRVGRSPVHFRDGACHARADIFHHRGGALAVSESVVAERSCAAGGSRLAAPSRAGIVDDRFDSGAVDSGCSLSARGIRHRAAFDRRRRGDGFDHLGWRGRQAPVPTGARPSPRHDSAALFLRHSDFARRRGVVGGDRPPMPPSRFFCSRAGVAHVLGGALTLAAAVIFTLTCFRLIPSAAAVGAGSAAVKQSPERAGA